MTDLSPEDAKIVTLARGARLRAHVPHTGVAEGAAVRDTDGRIVRMTACYGPAADQRPRSA